MTLLERIITQQVSTSVVATLSRTTEKIAEQLAQEILKDPEFRAQMRELVKRAFDSAFVSLSKDRATLMQSEHPSRSASKEAL